MNFFEHQEKARKQSRWIIVAFVCVALLIVLAVDIVVLLIFALQGPLSSGAAAITHSGGVEAILSPQFLASNSELLLTSSLATGSVIGFASLIKVAGLRSGGSKVAKDMGAVLVTPNVKDPLRRRLYNVVEEIALASGTPVPDVFVMEDEPAINAFAAGYTPADAAIAVTQGTLDKLSRSELQGVVAHEFSHILNGDMRINIRMMGVTFGILVLAIIGRKFLMSSRHRISSSRDNNGSVIVVIGLALTAIGYIGLFFARWMKSALSRQREYLADASAVQFTREPDGIAGALKKIAAYNHSSYLTTDAEEVSHMLFGQGYRSLMFATHPPLADRIRRIQKNFNAAEIGDLAKKLQKEEQREHIQAQIAAEEQDKKTSGKSKKGIFDAGNIIDTIGNPEFEQILAAAALAEDISPNLSDAAHSLQWAPEVLFYSLLDKDERLREKQLLIILQEMGDISEKKVSHLLTANKLIKPEQRLPLLEISFPTLKRRPIADINRILETVNKLVVVDNKVDSFEYLLSRLIERYMIESKIPSKSRLHGKKKISACVDELTTVISILAMHGQDDKGSAGMQDAQKAFRAGMELIGIKHKNLSFTDDWQSKLDQALETLRELKPLEKKQVVQALVVTANDDKKIVTEEREMLRAICSLINVPLPILNKVSQ